MKTIKLLILLFLLPIILLGCDYESSEKQQCNYTILVEYESGDLDTFKCTTYYSWSKPDIYTNEGDSYLACGDLEVHHIRYFKVLNRKLK